MPVLSEWLQLMLAEIARKREDLERARDEDSQRRAEKSSPATVSAADATNSRIFVAK
jgi:hypothetical protein